VPWAAVAAALLSLPTAFVLVVVGWGALLFANSRADGAVWLFGLLRGGPGEGLFGFRPLAVLVSLATTVLPMLPSVRRWVAERRRERKYPGSSKRARAAERDEPARG
jgi:hypothetical protein